MCILDGNAYDAKCLEAGQERDDDLDACALLVNNKAQPLLSPAGAAAHNAASKVVVQLTVCPHCPFFAQAVGCGLFSSSTVVLCWRELKVMGIGAKGKGGGG